MTNTATTATRTAGLIRFELAAAKRRLSAARGPSAAQSADRSIARLTAELKGLDAR